MKKISIIIPAYNEVKTIEELLNKIYSLKIKNFEKEIIIMEDNSSDGTREKVINFVKKYPECKLYLSKCPKGKGNAVRRGLKKATGDIFAIQDADLEYDVNDYHKLVKPFVENQAKFVLGSRHLDENGNKNHMIRKFHGKERLYAYIMNVGGIFFHSLFNLMYGTRISDPTTMYKLFTRDLYEKVNLKGNYFELDWEIVAKFVRLGYLPIEIPIKYESRGLNEGKKVRISRDALKWFVMLAECRLLPKSKL